MDNTINAYRNNVSFGRRILNIPKPESIPLQIREAIKGSPAIDKFIADGQPKNLLERFVDLFRKDKVLNVEYVSNIEYLKTSKTDPYERHGVLVFEFKNKKRNIFSTFNSRFFKIYESQRGVYNNKTSKGIVMRPGQHPFYDYPTVTVEDKIRDRLMELDDLDKKLVMLVDSED